MFMNELPGVARSGLGVGTSGEQQYVEYYAHIKIDFYKQRKNRKCKHNLTVPPLNERRSTVRSLFGNRI